MLGFFFEIVLRSSLQPYSIYFRIDDALRSIVLVGLVVSIYCYGKEKDDNDGGGVHTAQFRFLSFLLVDTFGLDGGIFALDISVSSQQA